MELPLFPLRLVLFPGARVPLHVFEERYRLMMDRVLSGDGRFGVAAILHGAEVGGQAETYAVGCVASVESVRRAPDGRLGILAAGGRRFRIERRLPDEPYPRAEADLLDEPPGEEAASCFADARAALTRYLSAVASTRGTDVEVPPLPADPVAASYAIAGALNADPAVSQQLLEAPDAATRLRLAAAASRREAALLEAVGPPAGREPESYSQN